MAKRRRRYPANQTTQPLSGSHPSDPIARNFSHRGTFRGHLREARWVSPADPSKTIASDQSAEVTNLHRSPRAENLDDHSRQWITKGNSDGRQGHRCDDNGGNENKHPAAQSQRCATDKKDNHNHSHGMPPSTLMAGDLLRPPHFGEPYCGYHPTRRERDDLMKPIPGQIQPKIWKKGGVPAARRCGASRQPDAAGSRGYQVKLPCYAEAHCELGRPRAVTKQHSSTRLEHQARRDCRKKERQQRNHGKAAPASTFGQYTLKM